MCKKRLFFIFLLLYVAKLFALNNLGGSGGSGDRGGLSDRGGSVFQIDVGSEFGILNGALHEYVFADESKNTDHMMSRLDWDVVAIPYTELNGTINLFKYVYINASGRIGFPCDSNFMQDYDWLNSTPPNSHPEWKDDNPTELTNYSKHNNELVNYYNVCAKVGGNIPIGKNVVLSPFVGYEYSYISMLASEGYCIYKQYDFDKRPTSSGPNISYAQESNSFIVGLNCDLNMIPRVPISFYFQAVPCTGQLLALDLHYQRKDVRTPYGLGFLDVYNYFFQFESKISAFFEFNKYLKMGGNAFIQYLPLQKGLTALGPIREGGLPPTEFSLQSSEGGVGRLLYGFSIVTKICF